MTNKEKSPQSVVVRAYKVARALHKQMECTTQMTIYSDFIELECTFRKAIKAPQLTALLDYSCDEICLFAADCAVVARLTYYTNDDNSNPSQQ